jgi:hypothetical protein
MESEFCLVLAWVGYSNPCQGGIICEDWDMVTYAIMIILPVLSQSTKGSPKPSRDRDNTGGKIHQSAHGRMSGNS